jgi:putative ABC transport system permease protein
MLDASESMRIAVGAVFANKGRGTLTALGVIIGIVAVTMTLTAFNGMRASFAQAAGSVGADVIYVSRMPWITMNDFFMFRNRPNVDLREAQQLERAFAGRAIVNPTISGEHPIKFLSETMQDITIIGTTEKMPVVTGRVPEDGRFLLNFDVKYKKQVAVIGADVAENLFGTVDPVDQTINIGPYRYQVIGVMEKLGGSTFGGPNFDQQVFVPISSFVKSFGGRRSANVDVAVKANSLGSMEDLEFEVIGEMRKIRKLRPSEDDNFSLNKLDSLMGAFNNIFGAVLGIGLLVTSISLVVGGIGVMNIMFVSVTERTREIGIRKSIGARQRSILMQFLFESALICLIGGIIGIGISALLTVAVNASGIMDASLSPGIMIAAVLLSVIVGVVAGLVPASRGARLNPVEALRYE